MDLEKMTLEELQQEINGLEFMIDNGCYGTKDMLFLDALYSEAERREYSILKSIKVCLFAPKGEK